VPTRPKPALVAIDSAWRAVHPPGNHSSCVAIFPPLQDRSSQTEPLSHHQLSELIDGNLHNIDRALLIAVQHIEFHRSPPVVPLRTSSREDYMHTSDTGDSTVFISNGYWKRESDELVVAEKLEKELKDLRRRREGEPVRSRACLIPVSRWSSRALIFS
jgi:hypothetical protein